MVATTQLQRRVRRHEQILVPQPPKDIVMVISFGPDEEPHGRHGHRKVHWSTGEAVTADIVLG